MTSDANLSASHFPEPDSVTSLGSEIVWRPDEQTIQRSRVKRFMDRHGIASYEDLLRRSTADSVWFWDAVAGPGGDLDLEWFQPYQQIRDTSGGLPWTQWFLGGQINYVHNALDKYAADPIQRSATALIWEGDDGATTTLSYGALQQEVDAAAHALQALGIGPGDRVGIYLPMIPQTVVAVLACGKIGAVIIPIFSGFAAAAVSARLNDGGAVALITADTYRRRGTTIFMKAVADEAVISAPSIRHVLVCHRASLSPSTYIDSAQKQSTSMMAGRDLWWDEALDAQRGAGPYLTARTAVDSPIMIIYTSGTTGRPKGVVHIQGGFPIKCTQDIAHLYDAGQGDILCWLSDLGWVMGPLTIIGTLTLGATLLIYEGVPDFPHPDRLWSLVERHRITILGCAPTAIRALAAHDEHWTQGHDLSSLRILGSTGEPWDPISWQWLFEKIGHACCPIINYSGGTEISGGIVGATTLNPLKPCAFSGPIPGIDADVVDEHCQPVRGTVGELIIRQPWPGMASGFWNDEGGERYLQTYWSRWPDVWVHGDWATIDVDGFWFIRGRSDDTIKVAGKRVGPAEVESAACAHPAVIEAAAIGIPHPLKGEEISVFVVLRLNAASDEQERNEVCRQIGIAITSQLGKALRPAAIHAVQALPKTRNGKILRRLVRASYMKLPLGDVSALENPATLDVIAALHETSPD